MKQHNPSSLFVDRAHSKLDYWIIASSLIFAFSLIYSKFLLSVGMIGILLTLFLPREGIWLDNVIKAVHSRKAFLGTAIIFFGVFFSGLNSGDHQMWMHHLRIKLPLLVLPLAVVLLPPIKNSAYLKLIQFFILICGISSVPVIFSYLMNFTEVNEAISRGIPMETPVNHIKYSLFIAFSGISGLVLWRQNKAKRCLTDRVVFGMSIWLVIYLHVLAVRSGLAVFYICLIIITAIIIIRYKSYKVGVALAVAIVVLPLLSVKFVPSLFRKVGYMNYDYMMTQKGEGRTYSDGERMTSYKIGIDIFRQHPLFGTGIGDLKQSCIDTYKKYKIDNLKAVYPHNQFLFVLAGMGVFGFIIFLVGSIWPMFYHSRKDAVFWILHIILFTSYLVENTIERSSGIGFYILFLLAALAVGKESNIKSPTNTNP